MSTFVRPEVEAVWEVPDHLRRELLAALSTDPAREPKMTFEEFLDWLDEDTHAELVDGRIIMSSPASDRHQMLASFFDRTLGAYVEMHGLGIVRLAPFLMRLGDVSREPDLLFVKATHRDRLRRTYLDGPADLVVEITSPESRRRDQADKFYEYREAGIPEYWIIDPDRGRAQFYQINGNGEYVPAHADAGGVYRSSGVAGFWLKVDWLWEPRLPDPFAVLLAVDHDAFLEHITKLQRQME